MVFKNVLENDYHLMVPQKAILNSFNAAFKIKEHLSLGKLSRVSVCKIARQYLKKRKSYIDGEKKSNNR